MSEEVEIQQFPWAIDDLIIHDETTIRSVLTGGDGLPAARVWLSQRHGYWPRGSGLLRQGDRLTLETYLLEAATRKAARIDLLQHLNPELEEPVRLLAVDEVIEGVGRDGVLLALGPWDVYCDDDGAWHVRDLLRPEDVEADLSGAWWMGPGEGMSLCEGFTELVTNPSFEVDLTGWTYTTDGAGGGQSRITTDAKFGSACNQITRATGGTYCSSYSSVIAVSASTNYALSCYCKQLSGTGALQLRVDWYTAGDVYISHSAISGFPSGTHDWVRRIEVLESPAMAAKAYIIINVNGVSDGAVVNVDAVNFVESDYGLPFRDGSMPGCAWTGTAHNSTTTVTAAELYWDDFTGDEEQGSVSFWWQPSYDWDAPLDEYTLLWRWYATAGAQNDILIFQHNANNNVYCQAYGGGDPQANANATPSWSAGDWLLITLTWDWIDAGEVILYVNGEEFCKDTSIGSAPQGMDRMIVGAVTPGNNIANGTYDELFVLDRAMSVDEVTRWYGYGRDALNARWMDVLCESAVAWAPGGVPSGRGLVSTLVVDGDVRWRQRDGDVAFWRIYDETWDITVDNQGQDDAWPEFRITPRTAKTSGFAYKQWHAVKWAAANEAANYPVLIGPTDYTGKAQADGDDIRVYVDGEEADRWLGGTLINDVNVWINLDFDPDISLTLAEAIAAAGDIDYVQFNEDIADLPVEGIITVEDEAFYYTAKNNRTRKVSGVTRATRGTAAAGHAIDTAAYWIQHDVWVHYDDATLAAPVVDDDYEPAFDLDNSDNGSWVYADFGEDDGLRAGQWYEEVVLRGPYFYHGNHAAAADPWEELGIKCWAEVAANAGANTILLPGLITNVNFSNGEKYAPVVAKWHGYVQSSPDGTTWATEYTIPQPVNPDAWEAWSYNAAIAADSRAVRLLLAPALISPGPNYVECADVTLTLGDYPTATAASELDNYPLECTITNETTGEAIAITAGMVLDQTLVVNTDEKSAILDDGTRLATAVEPDTVRRDWLRLVPGENALSFEETGAQEVEIDVLWDRRLFE